MPASLRSLPKIRNQIGFLYAEHARIEQEAKGIAVLQQDHSFAIPCANLSTLLLGPGTTITHAAIKNLIEGGCTVQWVGEDALRFYAFGHKSSSSVDRLYHQAQLWADATQRLHIIRRMYQFRFGEELDANLTLQQIRGLEGVRVRTAYSKLAKATGVPWAGREYKMDTWEESDPINRAISQANSCLYAVCQAAIQAVGYSPTLGFIHTGKPLSFVYDIADLYKMETSVPAAFAAVAEDAMNYGQLVRQKCREKFAAAKLMKKLVPDIDRLLGYGSEPVTEVENLLWDDREGTVAGGVNWAEEPEA